MKRAEDADGLPTLARTGRIRQSCRRDRERFRRSSSARVHGEDQSTSGLSSFIRYGTFCRASAQSLIEIIQTSPGSDISAMAQAGVPALGIMQDGRTYFNYHHSAADTLGQD